MKKLNSGLGLSCLASLFTTLAFFSSNTVVSYESAVEWLNLNYWNQINISNINFDLNHAVYIAITRFMLNYENVYGIFPAIFFVLCTFAYCKCVGMSQNKKVKIISFIGAFLYTSFTIIGRSFLADNSLSPIIDDEFQIFVTLINAVGFFIAFNWGIRSVFWFVDGYEIHAGECQTQKISIVTVLRDMGAMILLWLPYLVVFYPGTMNVDSLFEINEFLGGSYHTHYPLFHTVITGALFKAGQLLLNDNFGIFLCNIIQVIVAALVLSVSINLVCKMINAKKALLAFWGIFPIWPIWFYTLVKDSLYSLFVMFFVVLLIMYVSGKVKMSWKFYAVCLIDGILIVLLRNNGWALILFTLAVLMFVWGGEKKNLIIVFLVSLIMGTVINGEFVKALNANDNFNIDALSLPLQQTARYVSEFELTEDEYNTINRIIDINGLEDYEPEIADPVKGHGRSDIGMEDIAQYLKTYIRMFFKHPQPYFEAFFNLNYGYFYPDRTEYKDGIATYHINVWQSSNDFNLDLHPLEHTEFFRVILETLAYAIRSLPLIGLMYSTGLYTWLLLIVGLILIYINEYKGMLCLAPCIATILICMISPVNAYIRYALPVMMSAPFYLQYVLYVVNKRNKNEHC